MNIIRLLPILFAFLMCEVSSQELDFSLIGMSPTEETTPPTTTTTIITTTTETPFKDATRCHFKEKVCLKKWECKKDQQNSKYIINLRQKNNCHYLEECCDLQSYTVTRPTLSPKAEKCGFAHPTGLYMTIEDDNESVVNFGAYPWTVAIFNNDTNTFLCAGTLIDHKVILTTISCTGPIGSNLVARGGEWDLNTDREIFPHQDIPVESKILHEKYEESPEEYDIAILILKIPFKAYVHIQTVCLPSPLRKINETNCLVTGWRGRSNRPQKIMRKNMMSVSQECTNDPNSNLFCAVSQDEGLLYARGSALVCPWYESSNRYDIVGLWIHEAGKKDMPTYFLSITKLRPWLKEKLPKKLYNIAFQ